MSDYHNHDFHLGDVVYCLSERAIVARVISTHPVPTLEVQFLHDKKRGLVPVTEVSHVTPAS